MFTMNFYVKNHERGEKQLPTPNLPLAEARPVLVVAVSSSVEKEGIYPRNIQSKSFFIRIQEIFIIILYNDPDESI